MLKAFVHNFYKTFIQDHDGFTLDTNWGMDWFQTGKGSKHLSVNNGTVDACVRLYSQTISTLPIKHQRKQSDGSWKDVETSIPLALLHKPNDYESRAIFMERLVAALFYRGNSYIYAERAGGRYVSLHRANSSGSRAHLVEDDNGFHLVYTIGVNQNTPIKASNVVFPQNMIHFKINPSDYDPLRGQTPIESAAASIAAGNAINGAQAAFFNNGSRPSGVLSTDLQLNKVQIDQLREAFRNQSAEMNSGGIPILGGGLKFQPITMTSQDAQLIDSFRMSKQGICEAFGIPLSLIDQLKEQSPDIETLINQWKTTGLSYAIQVLETTLGDFFGFDPLKERFNLDEKVLNRTLFKDRMEALGKATLHGVYAPNEARQIEGLSPVDGGDVPYLQQQMIPVGAPNPLVASQTPEEAPADEGANEEPEDMTDSDKKALVNEVKMLMRNEHLK